MKPGHSRPVNSTAARVVSPGTSHAYTPDPCHVVSDTPLPVLHGVESPTFQDLTGTTFGRLTVIGYSATHKGRWVCRCVCGNYILRKTATVKSGLGAMCESCHMLQLAKAKELARRTGLMTNVENLQY